MSAFLTATNSAILIIDIPATLFREFDPIMCAKFDDYQHIYEISLSLR